MTKMSFEPKICPKCQKPKENKSGDLVSQMVGTCMCDALNNDAPPLTMCANCGRAIGERREGSMTQFIFQPQRCQCRLPEPVPNSTGFSTPAAVFEGYKDDANEEELDLESERFPIARYKPLSLIGCGSSGSVYLCRDRLLGKKVAIKILHDLASSDLIAFQEEARATSRLKHEKIVGIMDFGATASGVPYMVMEYVKGTSLDHVLKVRKHLETNTCVRIMLQICDALQYAHERNIFHRDIKPSNIILSEQEDGSFSSTVIDFGVATVKEATGSKTVYQGKALAGTPTYLPPDTVSGFE
ncbi:MAG: serine/threonine protein kinase, partial [Cyanobacteria bacterium]|nr:serine/threonine protein kinase [Cyanobacteriota bacterium]